MKNPNTRQDSNTGRNANASSSPSQNNASSNSNQNSTTSPNPNQNLSVVLKLRTGGNPKDGIQPLEGTLTLGGTSIPRESKSQPESKPTSSRT